MKEEVSDKSPLQQFLVNLFVLVFIVGALFGLVLLLPGCSHSRQWTLQGASDDIGTQNVRLVYFTDGVWHYETVSALDGRFSYTGTASDPVFVELFTNTGAPLGEFIVEGGDEIRARFSYLNPENIKIEGNDDAEALAEFIAGNRKAIDTGDSHALNLAIDRYIADRPDSFLATVLLTRFYTTRGYEKRAAELYAMIPEEYRRDGFVSGYGDLLGPVLASDTVIVDNVRAFAGDSLAFFSPRGARLNLLMLTTDKSRTADSLVTLVTTLTAATADSLLRITDMGCDRDTLYWHRSMRSLPDGFPRRVRHMWLNAGPATEGIAQTAPAAIPFFILTDSAGHVLWRGESASAARAAFGRLRNN